MGLRFLDTDVSYSLLTIWCTSEIIDQCGRTDRCQQCLEECLNMGQGSILSEPKAHIQCFWLDDTSETFPYCIWNGAQRGVWHLTTQKYIQPYTESNAAWIKISKLQWSLYHLLGANKLVNRSRAKDLASHKIEISAIPTELLSQS